MLRKFAYNKIFRTTGMLFLFALLLLFPSSKEYSLKDEKVVSTMNNSIKQTEIFLLDKNNYISRAKISISYLNSNDYANKLIELLILDGKYEYKIPNGFRGILPSDTKINSISINDNNMTIDISEDIDELDNKNYKKMLELITYNLTSIDGISNVYLKKNGKLITNYPNGEYIKQPLSRNNGVNEEYKITTYKNTSKTTIYYISRNNNTYYYVPITKINNDNREKIEVIIDELSSSHIYETNLMSFLNYNAKINSYKIVDKILSIDFNEYLFDDTNTKNILEEVIYSISLSVRENYDVEEVIFLVNGKEITKSVLKDIE